MSKVLVSDPINQTGIDILSQVATVDVKTGLKPEELVQIIGEYDALMIRSGTRVTEEIIAAGTNLKIIGRAGVGVDNVDVPAATRKGIVVVNSPQGNTIAAAEHALAMMMSLSRYIPDANASVKSGGWDRKTYVGAEVYKKTIGIVGLGKIGSHVAKVSKAMGMKLLAFDPFILQNVPNKLAVNWWIWIYCCNNQTISLCTFPKLLNLHISSMPKDWQR
ncbi:D-3-phosphoglycerate dehydrogenase [Richelia intracellularis]|nr:D-3-phosphoglycerate dehydrogenase [Richelia intracellularis]